MHNMPHQTPPHLLYGLYNMPTQHEEMMVLYYSEVSGETCKVKSRLPVLQVS